MTSKTVLELGIDPRIREEGIPVPERPGYASLYVNIINPARFNLTRSSFIIKITTTDEFWIADSDEDTVLKNGFYMLGHDMPNNHTEELEFKLTTSGEAAHGSATVYLLTSKDTNGERHVIEEAHVPLHLAGGAWETDE